MSSSSSLFSAKVKRLQCRSNFLQEERGKACPRTRLWMNAFFSSFFFFLFGMDTATTALLQVLCISHVYIHFKYASLARNECGTCVYVLCAADADPSPSPAPLFSPARGCPLPAAHCSRPIMCCTLYIVDYVAPWCSTWNCVGRVVVFWGATAGQRREVSLRTHDRGKRQIPRPSPPLSWQLVVIGGQGLT